MLRLLKRPHGGGAKDGEIEMSLGLSRRLVGVERVAGGRFARSQSLAVAGAVDRHSVCRRSSYGDDLAQGRRRGERLPRFFYFLQSVGRNSNSIASQLVVLALRTLPLPDRLLLVIDDSPTKRYGPHVEGADPAKPV